MKKYSPLIILLLVLVTACVNRNFQQQKFTKLQPIKPSFDKNWSTKDTSVQLHQVADLIIQHPDSVFIQTEKDLLMMRTFSYDSSHQEICIQQLMVVNNTSRIEGKPTVFIAHENLGNDNCFYLSDIDELIVDGKTYRPETTSKKEFSSTYKSNLPEQTNFPTGLLVFTIISALISLGFFIASFFTINNPQPGCEGAMFAIFWAVVLAILGGIIAFISVVLLVFFCVQLDRYLKYKKRK
jgi:hypothetical protein